jgi:hypothetical protein
MPLGVSLPLCCFSGCNTLFVRMDGAALDVVGTSTLAPRYGGMVKTVVRPPIILHGTTHEGPIPPIVHLSIRFY